MWLMNMPWYYLPTLAFFVPKCYKNVTNEYVPVAAVVPTYLGIFCWEKVTNEFASVYAVVPPKTFAVFVTKM